MTLPKRLLRSAALLAALMSLAAVAAVVFQTREINAQEYRLLRDAFKAGTPELRASIAGYMTDGKVSRWEYSAIVRQQWPTQPPMLDNQATNVAEERLVLAAMSRQVKQAN
ncbi:hypothetical protein WL93_26710 [Burkholderia diffusa]|uniref:hypothetical protein n=1 Tax=Burkholderia diffusa TaxID=488732 RepID=UPI000759D984|nr:hypothetical protein [Burkholderia diffusa]KWF77605.1 hypothetical protein WL93_26710 [Burkholderia diffusa]